MSEMYFCSNLVDLYASSGTSIYANHVTLSYTGAYSGNVNFGTIDGTCTRAMAKKNNLILEENDVLSNSLKDIDKEFKKILDAETKREDKKRTIEEESKIDEVIVLYKNVVKDLISKKEKNIAFSKLSHCYRLKNKEDEFDSYIASMLNDKNNSSFISVIKKQAGSSKFRLGKTEEAIALFDEVLVDKKIDLELELETLYEKGLALKYYMNDEKTADQIFVELIAKGKDTPLEKFALSQLSSEDIKFEQKEDGKEVLEDTKDKFEVNAYPNPFNPVTNIQFKIADTKHVKIKVYNQLGQLVEELTNKVYSQGTHRVTFNAKNLSSGVYYYTIEAGSEMRTNKILLIK
ncbi:MAG: T9SS type A sorting domain-containing protein [Melioribacteraceae bacterium]|nr:T9SS type A sorting domain-containing protein [Melioribacteraceae bacterium]